MEQNNINAIRGYSKAIFVIANQFNLTEQFLDLLEYLSMIMEDPRVVKLINNSILTAENKVEFLLSLTDNNYSPLIINLINLLAKNKHLLLVPEIYKWYDKLYLQQQDKLKVTVISAIFLNDTQKRTLETDLKNYLKKDFFIEYKIDCSIIAGIIIKYNDEIIDYSFKKKLLNLQQELLR